MAKTYQIIALILVILLPIIQSSNKPIIKCQVCQKVAHQLYLQVQDKQAQISPKKISEDEISVISKNVCNSKKIEKLVEQEDCKGQCDSECKTIEGVCQEVLGYSDTDVAEYLYKKKPELDSLVNFICNDLTEACSTKIPPVPKGMPGAPGMKIYSREDLMNNKFGDEDDDEDEKFPFKGKVLREKETIGKGIYEYDTSEAVKTHPKNVLIQGLEKMKRIPSNLKRKFSKSSEEEL